MTAAGVVDLHARRQQQRGAGARCRRHADRYVHGHDRGRHHAGGDDHHPWQQRCGPQRFRHLATGTKVTSDPPFRLWDPWQRLPSREEVTTAKSSIAGAGNDTINGTGKSDIIYAGSGNDTIKGNDGDDTIYGGSGSDTINGNNGGDTIIGGYGADHLTGSNGDDRFVYLSVADSNAARFDIISDFKSGSDKIDLTALGALCLPGVDFHKHFCAATYHRLAL